LQIIIRSLRFFSAMSRNDTETMSDLMTDDAAWWIAPGTRFSGLLTKVEYLHKIRWLYSLADGPLEMTFQEITAEADRVALIARGFLPLKDGRAYQGYYNFLLHIRKSQIVIGKEFLDAVHVNEIFGPDGTHTILHSINEWDPWSGRDGSEQPPVNKWQNGGIE
jgi:ketosteroid isomerase-like protein